MSNFTFAHNVFDAICILKSFNSHISVVVCNFFEIGTVSKWRIREWVKSYSAKCFTPLPDDKILVLSKLKAIIRNNININLKMKSVHSRVEKKKKNGENAGYLRCLLFPKCFKKAFSVLVS